MQKMGPDTYKFFKRRKVYKRNKGKTRAEVCMKQTKQQVITPLYACYICSPLLAYLFLYPYS